jgi:PleD family two-component response regulator
MGVRTGVFRSPHDPIGIHLCDSYMNVPQTTRGAPLVLLVNNQEWTARSVESVLRPVGYAVVKAYTGRQAKELAARLKPDLVIVDYRLSDVMGLDACRSIKDLPTVDNATPFIIATAVNLSRQERHECIRAGMWDIFSSPFDPIELVGKLETFLSARRQAEDAWEFTHMDPATGLYNWNGLLARAVELLAEAKRTSRWTACVAIGPMEGHPVETAPEGLTVNSDTPVEDVLRLYGAETEEPRVFDKITGALASATRDSDSTGILGSNDFLVLAPGTDEAGAAILANRLISAVNQRVGQKDGGDQPDLEFSAGFYAATDGTGGALMAQDLLGRSMEALRTAQGAAAGSATIVPFRRASGSFGSSTAP